MKTVFLTIILFTRIFTFEVASTPAQRAKGLMDRKEWGNIDGMIFVYQQPKQASYWMKDTYLGMSLLYLDKDYNILEIHQPIPMSTELIVAQTTNVHYVLEVKPQKVGFITNNYRLFKRRLIRELHKKKVVGY